MKKSSLCVVALAASLCMSLRAQNVSKSPEKPQPMAADANPSFEVATIKPSNLDAPDNTHSGEMGHRVVLSRTTVLFLLGFAYDMHDKQIADGPEWLKSQKFDFNAVSDTPGTPNLQQLKTMLQKLLVDRLQLKFHHETRELSAYVITVANSGPKLTRSQSDPGKIPSLLMQPGFPRVAAMKGQNLSMPNFAQLLQSGILDRPVVDHTDLQGKYDFLLTWTPDESQFTQAGMRMPPPSDSADAPPLLTAMQEQLGLRLTAERKAQVDVLVIDHIEQPSEN